MIKCRWIFIAILICLSSFTGYSQTVNLEIRQHVTGERLLWNLYDSYDHLLLAGEDFSPDEPVSLWLRSNRRYIFEAIISDASPYDSIILTLSLDGQPIIIVNGTGLKAGIQTIPFFTGDSKRKLKILGGSNADISLFPWQAMLISGNYLCGAAIIADNWVITAAHCLFDAIGREISPDRMEIRVGATDPYISGQAEIHSIVNVIIHESYTADGLDYDIALLELREGISHDYAQSISIITAEDVSMGATDPGVMATVTGWGTVQVDPEVLPDTLQMVRLPIVSNAVAAQVWGPIPASNLMAGYKNGTKDACSGDSGGPLVVPVDGDYKLAGIVSWGNENCNTYGAYTRISTFESWIRDRTGIQENELLESIQGDRIICEGSGSSDYTTTQVAGGAYEWQLAPPEAGSLAQQNEQAEVIWESGYTGTAMIGARVSTGEDVSSWKRLNISVVDKTVLNSQNVDTTLCEQEALQLQLDASGYDLSYDWYKDGSFWRTDTTGIIELSGLSMEDDGRYYGIVNGYCGSLRSGDFTITVRPLTGILSQSADTSVSQGSDVRFKVTAGGYALSYQWMKDGFPLSGQDLPELMLDNVNSNDAGIYTVDVDGTCGSGTSDSIYLYVSSANDPYEPDVYIWPTVSSGIFNIASNLNESLDLIIYNVAGQVIKKFENLQYRDSFDLSGKDHGIYLVNCISGGWRKTIIILKE